MKWSVAGGYTDLIFSFNGEDAYSYLFDGQIGYLDHALASTGLAGRLQPGVDLHGVTKPATIAVGHEADLCGRYRRGFVRTTNFALDDNRIDYDRGPASLEAELLLSVTGTVKYESYRKTAGE